MNQQPDSIRPRRRRSPLATTNPAIARAEQSTRVLIRVPATPIATSAAIPGSILQQPAKAIEHRDGQHERKETSTPTSTLKALLNEATPKRTSESPHIAAAQQQARSPAELRRSSEKSDEVMQPTSVNVGAAFISPTEAQRLRFDTAHAESGGPHWAPGALERKQSGVFGQVLQLRSVLAVAIILAGVIGIAIVLHGRTQHRPIKPDANPAANASRSDQKRNERFPEAAADAGDVQRIDGPAFARKANSATANIAAQNSSTGASMQNSAAGSTQWNMPAGANVPASVGPSDNAPQQATQPSQPSLAQGPFYSAQRETIQPPGKSGFMPDYRTPGAAAFDGSINNPSMPVAR